MNISTSDIKIAFPEEKVSAIAKNFEDIGYFLLTKNKDGEKELTLNYDYEKNTDIKTGQYNKIDFYYRKLKDNEYLKDYTVRYVKKDKNNNYVDLLPPKKVRKLELKGFDEYFESPKLIEGYRTTDKPYKINEDKIKETKEIIFVYTELGYIVQYVDKDTDEILDTSDEKTIINPKDKDAENTIYAKEDAIDIKYYKTLSNKINITHKNIIEKYNEKDTIKKDNTEYAVFRIYYKKILPFEIKYKDIDTKELVKETKRTGLVLSDEKEKHAKPVENYIKVGTKQKIIYRKNFFKNPDNPKDGYKNIEYIDSDNNITNKIIKAFVLNSEDTNSKEELFKKTKIFRYRLDLPYEVQYIDEKTEQEIANAKNSSLKDKDSVLEKAIDISGYYKPKEDEITIQRKDYIKENEDGTKSYTTDKIIVQFKYKKIPSSGLPFYGEIVPVKYKVQKLNKKDHFEYIQGYPDNSIKPEGYITREEVAAVFYRLLDEKYKDSIKTNTNEFKDINKSRWSNKHISTLAKGDILKGYEDNNFLPQNYITRAEVATIASRFDNLNKSKHNFIDINKHWAEKYIGSAHTKGWVKGYPDNTFKPDKYITRAEFVTLVNNVLDRKVLEENILPGIKTYTDLEKNTWYYLEFVEATNGHIYEKDKTKEIWKVLQDFNYDM